ncbi:acyltransferase family protein [Vibrio alfacsensis]|uniref:acyltransferase family protein n=1 Tax=Vibrio alfacsensis TaxID=1074311 RepID=UPI001BEFA761|nr:acyltransferase family protein [Vibrio alfacsensis]BCN25927.1 serine racemase [Vibrio alfacsensis]
MERNISLDILKLIMACMIVGLHANFLEDVTVLGKTLTVQGLFRVAVPSFLIINGYYFFQALSECRFNLWLKKVFMLYLVWMLVYSFYWFSLPDYSLKSIAILGAKMIMGYHHLWYLSGMIGAAIILFLLHKLSSPMLLVFSFLSFSTGVVIQYLGNYNIFEGSFLDKFFNLIWSHRNALFFSFPFMCLGFLFNKHSIVSRISLKWAIFGLSIGLFLLLAESYTNYLNMNEYDGFDNYFSLILVCPMIFVFISKIEVKGRTKEIALYSSAIYFIHSLILSLLKGLTLLGETNLTLLTIFASIIASYFIIELNKKIKILL